MATSNDLNISDAGYVVFDGTSDFTGRIFQAGTGITLTNASGVSGNTTITANGANDLHTAKFIVSSEGTSGTGANYTTISAAIAAAQGTGIPSTIFIMPGLTGTYTENFTLPANINLTAFTCDAQTPNVTIIGKITCSDAGSRTISGIRLQTNSDFSLVVSGTLATVVNLTNCFINCSNNTGISHTVSNGSSIINLRYCFGDLGTTGVKIYQMTSTGGFLMEFCKFTNSGSSVTASTNSAGSVFLRYTYLESVVATSGTTAGIQIFKVFMNTDGFNTTAVIQNSTNATGGSIDDSFIGVGSASAISIGAGATLSVRGCKISSTNTNAISGSGSLISSGLIFLGSSANINVTTQSVKPYLSLIPRTAISSNPYVVLSTDYFISVDTSVLAITVRLPNAPSTNQVFIIKDRTGSANTRNISVTTPGGAVTIDGSTTYTLNQNYSSIQVVFNGTSYEVF